MPERVDGLYPPTATSEEYITPGVASLAQRLTFVMSPLEVLKEPFVGGPIELTTVEQLRPDGGDRVCGKQPSELNVSEAFVPFTGTFRPTLSVSSFLLIRRDVFEEEEGSARLQVTVKGRHDFSAEERMKKDPYRQEMAEGCISFPSRPPPHPQTQTLTLD